MKKVIWFARYVCPSSSLQKYLVDLQALQLCQSLEASKGVNWVHLTVVLAKLCKNLQVWKVGHNCIAYALEVVLVRAFTVLPRPTHDELPQGPKSRRWEYFFEPEWIKRHSVNFQLREFRLRFKVGIRIVKKLKSAMVDGAPGDDHLHIRQGS